MCMTSRRTYHILDVRSAHKVVGSLLVLVQRLVHWLVHRAPYMPAKQVSVYVVHIHLRRPGGPCLRVGMGLWGCPSEKKGLQLAATLSSYPCPCKAIASETVRLPHNTGSHRRVWMLTALSP